MCILLILTETLNSCLFKFDKWSETVVFTDGQSHAKTKHRYRCDRTSADWRSSGLDFLRYSETGDGTFFCNEAPAQLQNLNIFVLPLEVLPPSYRFPAGCIRLQDLFRIVLHSFDPRGLLQRCVGTAWHTSRWGFCVFLDQGHWRAFIWCFYPKCSKLCLSFARNNGGEPPRKRKAWLGPNAAMNGRPTTHANWMKWMKNNCCKYN